MHASATWEALRFPMETMERIFGWPSGREGGAPQVREMRGHPAVLTVPTAWPEGAEDALLAPGTRLPAYLARDAAVQAEPVENGAPREDDIYAHHLAKKQAKKRTKAKKTPAPGGKKGAVSTVAAVVSPPRNLHWSRAPLAGSYDKPPLTATSPSRRVRQAKSSPTKVNPLHAHSDLF